MLACACGCAPSHAWLPPGSVPLRSLPAQALYCFSLESNAIATPAPCLRRRHYAPLMPKTRVKSEALQSTASRAT
eukprot:15450543-Alexandrium_andersonii.AAC.1